MFYRRRLRRRLWQNQPVASTDSRSSYFDLELTADQLFPLGGPPDDRPDDRGEVGFNADANDVKRNRT